MDFCSMVDLLYAALPLPRFRGWLLRAHMERCPRCQARLLSLEEAKTLLVPPDQMGGTGPLWQRIVRAGVEGQGALRPRPSAPGLLWRRAMVAAMGLAVVLTAFWLVREIDRPGFEAGSVVPAERFELAYVNVGGTSAQTFVYQPQGMDTVFVWASRTP